MSFGGLPTQPTLTFEGIAREGSIKSQVVVDVVHSAVFARQANGKKCCP